jgi:hypothetical protein
LGHLRTAQQVQGEATSSQRALQQSTSTPGAVFQSPSLSSSSDVPPAPRQLIASGLEVMDISTRERFISWLAANHKTWEDVGRTISNPANQKSSQNIDVPIQSSLNSIVPSLVETVGQGRPDSTPIQPCPSSPIPSVSLWDYEVHYTPLDQQRKDCYPVAREAKAPRQSQSHAERKHEPQDHQGQPIIPQKRNKREIFRTEGKETAPRDLAPTQTIRTHSTSIDHTSQATRLDMTPMDKQEDKYMNMRPKMMPQDTPSPSMATSVAIHSDDPTNKISRSPVAPKILTSTPHTLQSTCPETLGSDNTDMTLVNQERLFQLFGEFLKEAGLNSTEVSEPSPR